MPRLFSLEDVRVSHVQQSIVDIFNDHAVIASSIIWIERYRSVIQFFIKEIPEIDYVKWRPSVEMLKEEGLIIDLRQRRHEGRLFFMCGHFLTSAPVRKASCKSSHQ